MKRLSAFLLALALLLTGCAGQTPPEEPSVSAGDALAAMLAAAPEGAENPEIVSDDDMELYLALYGVEAAQVKQCAVARLGGARVFELAVIEAADSDAADGMAEALSAYCRRRWSDFGGYAPEQSAIAADGRAIRCGGPWVLLILSADPDTVYNAFLTFMGQEPVPSAAPSPEPTVSAPPEEVSPEPTAEPEPSPEPTPEPSPEPTPESSPEPEPEPEPTSTFTLPAGWREYIPPYTDDMTIYDCTPILEAWETGDTSQLSKPDLQVYNRCREIIGQVITEGMTDYEKEWAVYSWLISNVVYDWRHNDPAQVAPRTSYRPSGALVYGQAVCLGFATTFQLFMDLLDVECITVLGAAYSSSGDHAWNMVRLNGEWYCVDATWDLGTRSGPEQCRYFNVTSDWLAKTDHQWDYANTPMATATDKGRG